MPYFRLFYFPIRLVWNVFPVVAQRALAWVARHDQEAPPSRAGHLFVLITRGT